jgi:hypothetical protein
MQWLKVRITRLCRRFDRVVVLADPLPHPEEAMKMAGVDVIYLTPTGLLMEGDFTQNATIIVGFVILQP